MNGTVTFGSPDRFELAIGWLDDGSPMASRPKGYGFSLGTLRLTVRDYVLTAHSEGANRSDSVAWYLLPVFEWLAANWAHLFHEEDFPWPERTFAAAATACGVAFDRFLPDDASNGFAVYDQVRRWWERHALRAGAAGGLFPDLFLRRLGDGVELSWSGREADHAPSGYSFALSAGAAVLSVKDVAGPLWEAMQWVRDHATPSDAAATQAVETLVGRMKALRNVTDHEVRSIYLGNQLADRVERAFAKLRRVDLLGSKLDPQVPVVDYLAAPVAMFGGVDPKLTLRDVDSLSTILVAQLQRQGDGRLTPHVDRNIGFPLGPAHDEGYDLAERLLEDLKISPADFVDVEAILRSLGIAILSRKLETRTIRGVALAGEGLAPAVVINATSPFSQNDAGRRFTMAHELCHILYDQSRAKRVAQVSGPWAPGSVEKRANAFAAMLLMPRALLDRYRRSSQHWKADRIAETAAALHVSVGALTEHLYNLGYIDEAQREDLRLAATGGTFH